MFPNVISSSLTQEPSTMGTPDCVTSCLSARTYAGHPQGWAQEDQTHGPGPGSAPSPGVSACGWCWVEGHSRPAPIGPAREPPLVPGCPHPSYQCFHRHLKLDPNSGPRTPRKDTFCPHPPHPALLLWPMAGSQSPSVTTSPFKLNNPNNLSSLLITSKLCRMLYICK